MSPLAPIRWRCRAPKAQSGSQADRNALSRLDGVAGAVLRLSQGVSRRAIPTRDPRPNVTPRLADKCHLSGRHHRRPAGWHDYDRPVRVGDIGHVNGMDMHHDQEERDHGQRADQQPGEEPGVDFDCPIHNRITTYRSRGSAARPPDTGRHPGEVGAVVVVASGFVWWRRCCRPRVGRQTAGAREVDRARESEHVAQGGMSTS
jgi:hypothetical protein